MEPDYGVIPHLANNSLYILISGNFPRVKAVGDET